MVIKRCVDSEVPVRNIQAPINSSFQGTKYPSSSAGPGQPYIQEGPESPRRPLHTFNIVLITIHLSCSSVDFMQAEFGEQLVRKS